MSPFLFFFFFFNDTATTEIYTLSLHDALPILYVADASTFPSASGVNPMLTIMGIAHRAAGIIAARVLGPLQDNAACGGGEAGYFGGGCGPRTSVGPQPFNSPFPIPHPHSPKEDPH